MRFLLRPGWLAMIAAAVLFAVACYTLLAPWQFRRNAEQSAQNDAITASFSHPPQPLVELVPGSGEPPADVQWRQVTFSGRYLADGEGVVRLRTVDGNPAFEVLTPFRTDDGRVVAVDRGYVRPVQGNRVPPYAAPPDGDVSLTARIRRDETDQDGRPAFTTDGHRQLYAADSRVLATASGQQIANGYLQLVDGQAGGLGTLPLPDPDSGPFLSYAWQWLTFGAFALFGMVYFIRLELLQRRGARSTKTRPKPRPEPGTLSERYGNRR